ncbi:uncharacterized protein FIBRA_06632 [Fibroporia radiculosa]|uniref:Uncharacterized protein n=1 Tax=Fibroporia radiculosa TaxID=599839 RepID=J4HZF0_9APHY|nr:uncharacterized protein FIBRA_06632 [Fibroporia radiculosa]CCM04452.1 predicted protein [Fibroporia radiculosa]
MQHGIRLPVGPHPNWELDNCSPKARSLLYRRRFTKVDYVFALKQILCVARQKWLSTAFPKFSTKARGNKAPEVVPPPHTIKAHGRYDLTIGPHVFSNTAFYEVHYLVRSPNPTPPSAPPHSSQPALASTSFSGAQNTSYSQLSTTSIAVSALTGQGTPSAGVGHVAVVTPDLVSQVNIASMSNPTLKNLLHLASSGRATPDQLKTLGLLIQSLGAIQQPERIPDSQSSTLTLQSPAASIPEREFDIVIEFQEKSSDRWVIPRGPVVCERSPADFYNPSDVTLSMVLPFVRPSLSDSGASSTDVSQLAQPYVVTFRLSKVAPMLWKTLWAWSGGDQDKSKTTLDEIARSNMERRQFLQYRLPDGPLFQQIQAGVAPPYSTRTIVPSGGNTTRTRRRQSSRKGGEQVVRTQVVETGAVSKRKQQVSPKVMTPLPIACRACGQTDVPLMMGGRYCRICIEAGRAVDDIPQVTIGGRGPRIKEVSVIPVLSERPSASPKESKTPTAYPTVGGTGSATVASPYIVPNQASLAAEPGGAR